MVEEPTVADMPIAVDYLSSDYHFSCNQLLLDVAEPVRLAARGVDLLLKLLLLGSGHCGQVRRRGLLSGETFWRVACDGDGG